MAAKKRTPVKPAAKKKTPAKRKPAIDKKKDKAARKLDTASAKKRGAVKTDAASTTSPTQVKREAAGHARPRSSPRKKARKIPGYLTVKQREDKIAALLEVKAVEDCIKGVENYYKGCTLLDPLDDATNNMTIEEVMFGLEFIATNFNAQQAMSNCFKQNLSAEDAELLSVDSPQWYSKCTTAAKKNLGKYSVREFIQQQINQRVERLQVTSDWCWGKYKSWANLDITKVIQINTHENGRQTLSFVKDLDQLPVEVRSAITSISITTMGDIKVEFVNQKAALDQLCKLMNIDHDDTELEQGNLILKFDVQDEDA